MPKSSLSIVTRRFDVILGDEARLVGSLVFEAARGRQASRFEYADEWRAAPGAVALAPEMPLGGQTFYHRKPDDRFGSAFAGAFADTMPDAWGRGLVALEHRRRRSGAEITDVDHLEGIDDALLQRPQQPSAEGNAVPA